MGIRQPAGKPARVALPEAASPISPRQPSLCLSRGFSRRVCV